MKNLSGFNLFLRCVSGEYRVLFQDSYVAGVMSTLLKNQCHSSCGVYWKQLVRRARDVVMRRWWVQV